MNLRTRHTICGILMLGSAMMQHPADAALVAQGSPGDAWQVVAGDFQTIADLAIVDETEAWAATDEGLAHYDGLRWRLEVPSGFVTAVSIAPDGTGWAGTNRGALRLDGDDWLPAENGWEGYVLDLEVQARGRGWAIESTVIDGLPPVTRLVQLGEEGWRPTPYFVRGTYDSMVVIDDRDIWLVGGLGIAHFDGEALSPHPVEVPGPLMDISFSDPMQGWAVGGDCRGESASGLRPVVMRFQDGRWSEIDSYPEGYESPILAVAAMSNGGAIVGGHDGTVLRLDAKGIFTYVDHVQSRGGFCEGGVRAIEAADDSESLLIGVSDPLFGASIHALVGSEMVDLHGQLYDSLALDSADGGWVVADQLFRFDDRGRSIPVSGEGIPDAISEVTRSASGAIWLAGRHAGEAVVSVLEDGAWRMHAIGSAGRALRVEVSPEGRVWVGGDRLVDDEVELFLRSAMVGSEDWREDLVIPGDRLQDLSVGPADHLLLLTANMKIHQRHHGRWSVESISGPVVLQSVVATENGGWAVGDRTIVRLQNGTWTAETRLAPEVADYLENAMLADVYAEGDHDAWAVGAGGNVLRLLEGLWRFDRVRGQLDGWGSSNHALRAIDLFPEGPDGFVLWAAGDSGTLIRRERLGLAVPPTPDPTAEPMSVVFVPRVDR